MHNLFREMVEKWPSAIVARRDIAEFTGGLISPKGIANLDSQGLGPPAIRIGRNVAYPAKQLAEWLEARAIERDSMHWRERTLAAPNGQKAAEN